MFSLPNYIVLLFVFFTTSCVSIKTNSRIGKDQKLNNSTYTNLNGNYVNTPTDINNLKRTLFSKLSASDSYLDFHNHKNCMVKIVAENNKKLKVSLVKSDTVLKSINLYGKFKNGYFKVKKQHQFKTIFGPIIWLKGTTLNYIGVTYNKNLVVLNSGAAISFLLALPFYTSGNSFVNEYLNYTIN